MKRREGQEIVEMWWLSQSISIASLISPLAPITQLGITILVERDIRYGSRAFPILSSHEFYI